MPYRFGAVIPTVGESTYTLNYVKYVLCSMMPVNTPQRAFEGERERRGNLACGVVGLGVVSALFLTQYTTIVAMVENAFGVLSSTAIVWLFVTAWLVCWLGMELAIAGLSRRWSLA